MKIILLIILLTAITCMSCDESYKSEYELKKQENENLNKEINNISQQYNDQLIRNDNLKKTIDNNSDKYKLLEKEINDLTNNYNNLQGKIEDNTNLLEQISTLNTRLQDIEGKLIKCSQEKNDIQIEKNEINSNITKLKEYLNKLEKELKDYKDKIKKYDGLGIEMLFNESIPYTYSNDKKITILNNPNAIDTTYTHLQHFLINDSTEYNTYNENNYNCANFAADLCSEAEKKGIDSAFVALFFKGKDIGHAISAFNTVDRGMIYIDETSGTDLISFSDKIRKGYTYPPYDTYEQIGTITKIEIYW